MSEVKEEKYNPEKVAAAYMAALQTGGKPVFDTPKKKAAKEKVVEKSKSQPVGFVYVDE